MKLGDELKIGDYVHVPDMAARYEIEAIYMRDEPVVRVKSIYDDTHLGDYRAADVTKAAKW